MANETNKSTEILEFKVEQGAAITELEKTKKSIIGLKEEQKQLNDAYKKGYITQEELAKELVRVETLLKKQGNEYNNLTKKVTGVQTETSKLIASNQKLAQAFKESSQQINVAGVNVGQLQSKITALANPVTAAVAVVGALGAAYARSTIGAKDLAFASSQLSNAVTILTNDFASLLSQTGDGEGAVTGFFNNLLASFGPAGVAFAQQTKALTLAGEELEDLQREEIRIRGQISERLAENQELLTEISDEQTSVNRKAEAFSSIIGNLRVNQFELVDVLEQQLQRINAQLAADSENEDLQTAKLQKEREIEKAKSDTEKRIQAILRLEDNVAEAQRRQVQLEKEKTSELERQQRIAILERSRADNRTPIERFQDEKQIEVDTTLNASKAMAEAVENLSRRTSEANKKTAQSNKTLAESTDAQRDSLRLFSSEAARLYQTINQENKYFAAAQLAVDAGLTLSAIERNAAQLGPTAGNFYRAAAILSATASLTQAAKLIGANSPDINSLGPTITSSAGKTYVIQNGEAVPIEQAQAKAARGQQITSDLSTVGTSVALGAAIGGAPGAVAGLLVGGLIVLGKRLFGKKRKGYSDGGWTGPGEMQDVAGVVHADEYVVPKNIKNAQAAQPHLRALEQMRQRGYATGGYTTSAATNDMGLFVEAIRNLNVIATIEDIDNAKKRKAVKMRIVTR